LPCEVVLHIPRKHTSKFIRHTSHTHIAPTLTTSDELQHVVTYFKTFCVFYNMFKNMAM